jgi:hypothetical protein
MRSTQNVFLQPGATYTFPCVAAITSCVSSEHMQNRSTQ